MSRVRAIKSAWFDWSFLKDCARFVAHGGAMKPHYMEALMLASEFLKEEEMRLGEERQMKAFWETIEGPNV